MKRKNLFTRPSRKPARSRALRCEGLEERRLLASSVVNSTGDQGDINPGDGQCQVDRGGAECTLRAAIEEANAGGAATISFDIPRDCGHVIQPASALPTIQQPVVLDGYTQPGSSVNTLPIAQGTNARICIEVNGGLITDGSSGLVFESDGNTIRGLSVTGFAYPDVGDPGSPPNIPIGGVVLLGDANLVEGNFIGVDPDGTTAEANNFTGLFVKSSHNVIGGPRPEARNLISGNQGFGVHLTSGDLPSGSAFTPAEFNRIQGNLIGTDRSGTQAVPNTAAGVMLTLFARNNLIGGRHQTTSEVRNIISGNGGPFSPLGDPEGPYQDWPDAPFPMSGGHGDGIHIGNLTLSTPNERVPNTIQGNFIGTTADGTAALPNLKNGITLVFTNSVTVGGPRTSLTSECTNFCNLISANVGHGINISSSFNKGIVVEGNFIGTDVSGQQDLGNGLDGVILAHASGNMVGGSIPTRGNVIAHNRSGVVVLGSNTTGRNPIRLNSIHSNSLLGIDLLAPNSPLDSDGPTLNDSMDPDIGPNGLQNFPVIATAQFGADTFVVGRLNSLPNRRFRLDFYASAEPDPTGFGEGARWLGTFDVITNAGGDASFSKFLPGATVSGEWLSATATRIQAGQQTDTSEFSRAYRLGTGVGLDGCTLQVHGGDGADDIQVARVADQIQVTASFLPLPDQVRTFGLSAFDTLELLTGGGIDNTTMTLGFSSPAVPTTPPCDPGLRIRGDLGDGNDSLNLNLHAFGADPGHGLVSVDVELGAGDDSLQAKVTDLVLSDSSFSVSGNNGLDVVDLLFQNSQFENVVQKVHGGADADNVKVAWNNIELRSDTPDVVAASLAVDGESGADTLNISDSGVVGAGGYQWMVAGGSDGDSITVGRASERIRGNTDVEIDAGTGADNVMYSTSGLVIGGEDSVRVSGGSDSDRISVVRSLEQVQSATLVVHGDAGNDVLNSLSSRRNIATTDSQFVTGDAGHDAITHQLRANVAQTLAITINGDAGNDSVRMLDLSGVYDRARVQIDAGPGLNRVNAELSNFRLNGGTLGMEVRGGTQRDVLRSVVGLTATSSGDFQGLVSGNDGDDDLQFHVTTPASVVVSATLDGGLGADTCLSSGVTVINCEA